MDAGHERGERAVDHLVALDQRVPREARARHVHGEVIAAARRVLGDDLRVGKRAHQAAMNLLRAQHRTPAILRRSRVASTHLLWHGAVVSGPRTTSSHTEYTGLVLVAALIGLLGATG